MPDAFLLQGGSFEFQALLATGRGVDRSLGAPVSRDRPTGADEFTCTTEYINRASCFHGAFKERQKETVTGTEGETRTDGQNESERERERERER